MSSPLPGKPYRCFQTVGQILLSLKQEGKFPHSKDQNMGQDELREEAFKIIQHSLKRNVLTNH